MEGREWFCVCVCGVCEEGRRSYVGSEWNVYRR